MDMSSQLPTVATFVSVKEPLATRLTEGQVGTRVGPNDVGEQKHLTIKCPRADNYVKWLK